MIQVYKIDEYGFYTFETYKVEEPNEFEITTPCKTCEEDDFYKPKWEGDRWVEGATQEDINEINKIDICLDDLKQQKVKDSKTQLEVWLGNNPIFSTVHNPQGEYYTVTYEKQSLITRNLMLAQLSQSETTTWNSTADICEEWSVTELSQLALEIEEYVRPRITKQQRYEVEINACTTMEELDAIVFDYECI